jgi:C1A family cysteine protease
MAQVYGWSKDARFKVAPDGTNIDLIAQDKKFEELASKLNFVLSPGDVDLSQYCVAMDQYQLSSCCGNATCEGLEILENIATGNATLLSRLFTYAMARTIEGTLNVDNGTHVRTCFDTLSLMGVCTEDIWPYVMTQVNVSPSIIAQQQAVGHKITGYYRITSTGSQRLTDVKTALANKHPVVIGTQIGQAFEHIAPQSLGPLPPPTSGSTGGHALVIVGNIGTNFLIKNSWGTGWGQNGLCLFTEDYITWDETDDLWVPTIAPVFP